MDPAMLTVQTLDNVPATSDAKVIVEVYQDYWKNGGLEKLAANQNDPRVILENALNTPIMAKIKTMRAEDLIDGYALKQELNSEKFLQSVNEDKQMQRLRLRVVSIFGDGQTVSPITLNKEYVEKYQTEKAYQAQIGSNIESEKRLANESIRKAEHKAAIELNNNKLELKKQLATHDEQAELHAKEVEKKIEREQQKNEARKRCKGTSKASGGV